MSDINDVKKLRKIMGEAISQAEILKRQRDTLNSEAEKWIEKRNFLNLKNRKSLNDIKVNKSKRDEINEIIKKLKNYQAEIAVQSKKKREEYFGLREKVNKILGRNPQNIGSVKHQINELDWQIQTNPLSLAEEKEVIEQIRLLERKILINKEASGLKDRLIEIKAEIGVLRIKNNEIYNQITDFVKKSQEYHNTMCDKIDKIKPQREEADTAHKKYQEFKKSAYETHEQYLALLEQIKILNFKIKQIDDMEYNERLNKNAKTAVEIAYGKLKNKKKLTLDEFKLLKEKGLI